jgi:hypothetical protein
MNAVNAHPAPPSDAPTAPLQIELAFVLRLTPAEAFDLMAHRLHEWFDGLHAVRWDHSRSLGGPGAAGACSERSCDFGGKALREVIASYQPGVRYTYRADLARSELKLPLQDHLGSFDFQAAPGGCLVTWRQYFRPRWFVPGAVLRWQMRDRMMRPSVERLLARHEGRWADPRAGERVS